MDDSVHRSLRSKTLSPAFTDIPSGNVPTSVEKLNTLSHNDENNPNRAGLLASKRKGLGLLGQYRRAKLTRKPLRGLGATQRVVLTNDDSDSSNISTISALTPNHPTAEAAVASTAGF